MRKRDVKPNKRYKVKDVPLWMEERYAPIALVDDWRKYVGKVIKTNSDEDGSFGVVWYKYNCIPCCALKPLKPFFQFNIRGEQK